MWREYWFIGAYDDGFKVDNVKHQNGFTTLIRANSSNLKMVNVYHQCTSDDSSVIECEEWNGFWDVESYTELLPSHERGLPANFLVTDWGIHNTTDNDWEVMALCNANEMKIFGSDSAPFEFPGYTKMVLPTRHQAIVWKVIESGAKKSAISTSFNGVSDVIWGTCDFSPRSNSPCFWVPAPKRLP